MYAFAPWMVGAIFPGQGLWILCASRLMVGFGTGTISVCKAYLAANAAEEERTKVIAWSGMVGLFFFLARFDDNDWAVRLGMV